MNLILVYQHYIACPEHDGLGEPFLKFFYSDFASLVKFVQFNMNDIKVSRIYLNNKECSDIEFVPWYDNHTISHLTLKYYNHCYTIRNTTMVDAIIKEITSLQ